MSSVQSACPIRCLARAPWVLVACLPLALLGPVTVLAQEALGLHGALPAPVAVTLPRALREGWSAEIQRDPDQASQATLWRSLGRMSIGLGLQSRPANELQLGAAPERDSSELLVGVAVRTGRQTRLSFQSSPAALLGATVPAERQPGTMVLQSSDPYRALRRGVLRMDLDNSSAVNLRMRKRLLMLQYSKSW
jgi:hypothetical protein